MKQRSRRKIAFVTPIYSPAPLFGSDMVVKLLSEEFVRMGHDVTIITSNARKPLYWYDPFFSPSISQMSDVIEGVNVIRLACNQYISSSLYIVLRLFGGSLTRPLFEKLEIAYAGPWLKGLDQVLKHSAFDVIHISPFPLYLNKQVVDAVDRLRLSPLVIVTPFFHAKVPVFQNSILGDIMRSATTVHAVSHSEKKEIIEMHHTPPKKIVVAPLFIDTRSMHEVSRMKDDIQKFKKVHMIENRIIILFAGIKGHMKGAIDTLHAVHQLYQKDSRYLCIAIGNNTSEWQRAKKDVDQGCYLDLGYTTGYAKEIVFGACDMFCMPSMSDSFGLVYLEAWHKRKPVIAAKIPAIRELIQRHTAGVLVTFGRRKEIQDAIERLATNPVLSNTLGRNGYSALKKHYTVHSQMKAYKRLFGV